VSSCPSALTLILAFQTSPFARIEHIAAFIFKAVALHVADKRMPATGAFLRSSVHFEQFSLDRRRLAMLLAARTSSDAPPMYGRGLWQKRKTASGVWSGVVSATDVEGADRQDVSARSQRDLLEMPDDRKNARWQAISFIRNNEAQRLEYEGGNGARSRDGEVWKAKMSVSADGQELTLRGYVLTPLLGKNETCSGCRTPRWRRSIRHHRQIFADAGPMR